MNLSFRGLSRRRSTSSMRLMAVSERLETRCLLTTLPTGFTEATVVTGLQSPTAMEVAPDGRIFVCEQGGTLRVIKDGVLLATPFVSLSVNSDGERGLLGVAFDPNFDTNSFVYVYYTVPSSPRHNRVSRFTANGDVAVVGSERIIFELPNLSSATNHNGGAIHFGIDGKLYIAVGDNANGSNAPLLTTQLGKLLRINKDGTIPSDNPFFNSATGNNRAIWARGLRNPFTFAVQPGTGRTFINDVGQSTFEEINEGVAGSNYGWPSTEGVTNADGIRGPLFAYGHSGATNESGCAIAGGAFYSPETSTFPADFAGDYFFADLCNNWVRRYDVATGTVSEFATDTPSLPVDLKVQAGGSLLLLTRGFDFNTGTITRFTFDANSAPSITLQPANLVVTVGQSAFWEVAASGPGTLSFQWQRNNVDIDGATSSSFTLNDAALSDSGANFRCIVTNVNGSTPSNSATLTVNVDQPPVPTITLPTNGSFYRAGEVLTFSGGAIDPEEGALPPSQLTWKIDFHHDDHTHPFLAPTSGISGGQVTIPNSGETSSNVFLRITLTASDSHGNSVVTTRDILPRTSNVTLASNIPGAILTLDGQPFASGVTFNSVTGLQREIGLAATTQTMNNIEYQFVRWSDGGETIHQIATPETNTTLLAIFRRTDTSAALSTEFQPSNGTLTLTANTAARVTFSTSLGNVVVKNNNVTVASLGTIPAASVRQIVFIGSSSADRFDASGISTSRFTTLQSVLADGREGNDTLIGTATADTLFGSSGDDSITGNTGDDCLFGDADRDRLFGSSGNDKLSGGEGDDSLSGSNGNDSMTGGLGNDTFSGGSGSDLLIESADVNFALSSSRLTGVGTDLLSGIDSARLSGGESSNRLTSTLSGPVTLIGGGGNDTLTSADGADLLSGEEGEDVLSSGAGQDTLLGGNGNDTLFGDSGNDRLDGAAGNDFLRGGSGNDTIDAGQGNDLINGGVGDDRLNGNDGNDGLAGSSGNDLLDGGAGKDTLVGGNNNDTLLASFGDDIALGESGDDTVNGGGGNNTLSGGPGNDQLTSGLGDVIDESFSFFDDWVAAV